jgi:hypothetical protein
LTTDAWQASNSDGYLAVTGHWVEERNGKWTLEHALLGFTQLNTSHNGKRLGQALYKICNRLGIVHKVLFFSFFFFAYPSLIYEIGWPYHMGQRLK